MMTLDTKLHHEFETMLLHAMREHHGFAVDRPGTATRVLGKAYDGQTIEIRFRPMTPPSSLCKATDEVKYILSDEFRRAVIQAAVPQFASAVKHLLQEQERAYGELHMRVTEKEASHMVRRYYENHKHERDGGPSFIEARWPLVSPPRKLPTIE